MNRTGWCRPRKTPLVPIAVGGLRGSARAAFRREVYDPCVRGHEPMMQQGAPIRSTRSHARGLGVKGTPSPAQLSLPPWYQKPGSLSIWSLGDSDGHLTISALIAGFRGARHGSSPPGLGFPFFPRIKNFGRASDSVGKPATARRASVPGAQKASHRTWGSMAGLGGSWLVSGVTARWGRAHR